MSPMPSNQRGMFFEEFEAGQEIVTAGRTITETDIVRFAGISGDYNQIHTDAEYCKTSPFGKRVAHGLLILSIASGLVVQTGVMEGTVMAFRDITNWKFTKPVYIGDTIRAAVKITETKGMRRIGGGAVKIEISVINQDDEVVMKGVWTALIAGRGDS